jgi:hypothetical protein
MRWLRFKSAPPHAVLNYRGSLCYHTWTKSVISVVTAWYHPMMTRKLKSHGLPALHNATFVASSYLQEGWLYRGKNETGRERF